MSRSLLKLVQDCGGRFAARPGLRARARRLVADEAGNVLILWGAALLPLIALVGSAIDIGAAYVARKEMQTACDAAVLAGRRAMDDGVVDDGVRAEATKFFNFNFAQGAFGTAAFTPSITSPPGSSTTVVITAETTQPTTFMRMFGFSTLPIKASCNAKQDFVNTDIVLVLDTTGSMDDKIRSTDTNNKMVSLRAAVLALYDQLSGVQQQLAASGLRLRYGVVPYASAVNVGKAIRAANPSYLLSSKWSYFSREVAPTDLGFIDCITRSDTSWFNNRCNYFKYGKREYDISRYVAGEAVNVGPLIGTADSSNIKPVSTVARNTTWAGCIEERQTARMSSTAGSIPSNAYDLDINFIPNSDETRWKPYWPEVEYTTYKRPRSDDPYKPQTACPTAAAEMQVWSRGGLVSYLNTLQPDGGTYHDNGMMWGARWASSGGIFGPKNPDTHNSMPVKKYIIFMTDGVFDTGYSYLYSGYGVEQLDARVTPGGGSSDDDDQLARHKRRFSLLCSQAKSMGYSVWVIGFDTVLDSSLTNCASTSSQASTSGNQAALIEKFVEIGQNIGALRLTE